MKKLLFTISIAVIASLNILAQGYRNPVLPGFHADPSVCTNGKLFARSNIRLGELCHSGQPIELKNAQTYIRISSDKDYYYMQVSADGKSFTTLSKMDYRYLSTEVIGGFTGVMLGLFAQGEDGDGYADFDWFEYITE